jgi:predicted nucleic acid-binding protein
VTAVIDATAVVAFCLNEEGLNRERVASHLRSGVVSIDLVRVESANAILVSKRRGIVQESQATLALSSMLEISRDNIKIVPQDDNLISDAFQIGQSANLAIYDSLYLSLAMRVGASLLSKDQGQIRAARELGIEIEDV